MAADGSMADKATNAGMPGYESLNEMGVMDQVTGLPKLRAVSVLACIVLCGLFWAGVFLAFFG